MATKIHLEVLEMYCVATQHQGFPTNYDMVYLMGGVTNGAKSNTILVGDPLQVKNPGDTFVPLPMQTGQTYDLEQRAPTMFQTELDIDETDQVGIAVGAYSQSLSHQWATYDRTAGDVAAAVGDVVIAAGGKDNKVTAVVGSLLKSLPTLIKDINDLDKDTLLGGLELVLAADDMYPSNGFHAADMTNGGHYIATYRITRDDRDYRAAATAVSYPTGPVGGGSGALITITLHNTGRQTFAASRTHLVTVLEDESKSPWSYTEYQNDWFGSVPLAADAAPGSDFVISFSATAPADAKMEQLRLALKVDGIGIVPLDGNHTVVLQSGKTMNVGVQESRSVPGLGGWYHSKVFFTVKDATTLAPVPAGTVQVYADGKLVGDATQKYDQSVKTTGKPPNDINTVAIPNLFELRAAGYFPSDWSALG